VDIVYFAGKLKAMYLAVFRLLVCDITLLVVAECHFAFGILCCCPSKAVIGNLYVLDLKRDTGYKPEGH
jgi:hypothetical protein